MTVCRFFGGPWDGRVLDVEESLLAGIGVVRVPVAPSLSGLLDAPDTFPVGPTIHTYTWDRTVNEHGERRMRWDYRPEWRPE